MRVLVKGAGVAGLTVAFELAGRGVEVTVVDRAPALGGGASWMAGGMLAPWCEAATAEPAVVSLGGLAADWWEAALPGLVSRKGTLVVAPPRDRSELTRFSQRTSAFQWLDENAVAALEPDLAGRFRSGLFFAREAHLDPRKALGDLLARIGSMGARCLFGVDDAPSASRYDRIVDCTGLHAAPWLPDLRGVRGEMLYLESRDVALSRPVRLIHPRVPVYIVPRGDGRFMVGATMIESGDGGAPSARSVMELLNAAYALHPAFGEARIIETGVGVRPSFPDNLPRVIDKGDTVFVNGLHRHGFLLAPAMARRAADIILKNTPMEIRNHETDRQRATA